MDPSRNKDVQDRGALETQDIYRNLVESLQSGIYMADSRGDLFFVNQAFVDILGYEHKQDLLGHNLARELYLRPAEREVFLKKIEEAGYVKDYEVRNVRKDGEVVILSVNSSFILDANGGTVGVQGIVQDITDRRRLEENLKSEKAKLEEILGFDERISSILRLDELVDFIVEKATRILEAEKCSLMLFDRDAGELLIRRAKGLDEEVIQHTRLKLGENIAGIVAQEGRPILVVNIELDPKFSRKNRTAYRTKSFLSVPIKLDNRLIGVVNVSDPTDTRSPVFNQVDLKILSAIVRQAAVAIENAKLYRELEYLSNVDGLTQLSNYRYFSKSLDSEIDRLKRYPGVLSLMMIDLDGFKNYNDQYGHLEGDNLLRKIGETFKHHLRSIDIVCRYGGDEFAVILPGTSLLHAQAVGEKLRKCVSGLSFLQRVTLSIGIAEYHPAMNRFELVRRADQALYRAKKEGKDKVCVWPLH